MVQDLSILNEHYLLRLLRVSHLDLIQLDHQITLHLQHLKIYCLYFSLGFSKLPLIQFYLDRGLISLNFSHCFLVIHRFLQTHLPVFRTDVQEGTNFFSAFRQKLTISFLSLRDAFNVRLPLLRLEGCHSFSKQILFNLLEFVQTMVV